MKHDQAALMAVAWECYHMSYIDGVVCHIGIMISCDINKDSRYSSFYGHAEQQGLRCSMLNKEALLCSMLNKDSGYSSMLNDVVAIYSCSVMS